MTTAPGPGGSGTEFTFVNDTGVTADYLGYMPSPSGGIDYDTAPDGWDYELFNTYNRRIPG